MRAITYEMNINHYRVLAEVKPECYNEDCWECSDEPSQKEIKVTPEDGWEKVFPCVEIGDFFEEDFRFHYREILRDGYLGYHLSAFSVGYNWITLVYVNDEGSSDYVTLNPGSNELCFIFEGPATQSGIIPTYHVWMYSSQGAEIEEDLGAIRRYTKFKLKDENRSDEYRTAWENVCAEVTEFTEI